MTPALSDDLKSRILTWYIEGGYTYREICGLGQCSIGTVAKVMKNYREFGELKNPFTK